MSTTPLNDAVRATNADLTALLAISNMAYVASTGTELEVIHLQSLAAGIESLANERIDALIRELDAAGAAAREADHACATPMHDAAQALTYATLAPLLEAIDLIDGQALQAAEKGDTQHAASLAVRAQALRKGYNDLEHLAQYGAAAVPDTAALMGAMDGVVLACGADLTPEPVRWLWRHWLALGKLHILAGAPDQGKTTIAVAMCATITIGGRWPDGTHCEPSNVLFWSGEDDPADTLVPRLMAAGADRSRCYFIQGARRDGEVLPFDPARDLRQLQQAIEQIGGIRLLVIDPVVSAVTGDSHKNTEVRRALQPLVDLAAACDCAVLGITHFAKGGQGTDPAQRVVGSLHAKAGLRKFLESWRGRPFTAEELAGFDLKAVVGLTCLVGIVHEAKGDKVYANLSSVMKLPKGMPAPAGEIVPVSFDMPKAAPLPPCPQAMALYWRLYAKAQPHHQR